MYTPDEQEELSARQKLITDTLGPYETREKKLRDEFESSGVESPEVYAYTFPMLPGTAPKKVELPNPFRKQTCNNCLCRAVSRVLKYCTTENHDNMVVRCQTCPLPFPESPESLSAGNVQEMCCARCLLKPDHDCSKIREVRIDREAAENKWRSFKIALDKYKVERNNEKINYFQQYRN
jgi:hypothetical protein